MNRNRLPLILLLPGLGLLAGCASGPEPVPPDCSDAARFERALEGAPVPPACSVMAPDEAYGLGQMIAERRAEAERIRRQLAGDPVPAERVKMQQALIRIERDLPELEALARFEGWLPPTTLPDHQ